MTDISIAPPPPHTPFFFFFSCHNWLKTKFVTFLLDCISTNCDIFLSIYIKNDKSGSSSIKADKEWLDKKKGKLHTQIVVFCSNNLTVEFYSHWHPLAKNEDEMKHFKSVGHASVESLDVHFIMIDSQLWPIPVLNHPPISFKSKVIPGHSIHFYKIAKRLFVVVWALKNSCSIWT